MGERRGTRGWEYLMEVKQLEDRCVDGRIISKRTYKIWDEGAWAG
jgi:hypothetical protein